MSLIRRHPSLRTAGSYRDPVTLRVVGRALFALGDLESGQVVKVRATATAEQAMKPLKVIVRAHLTATYDLDGLVGCEVDGLDVGLTLLRASFGDKEIVSPEPKLSLFTKRPSLGGGISFPVIEAGKEVCLEFGVMKEILCHLPPAPEGKDPLPTSLTIKIETKIYGEPLREAP